MNNQNNITQIREEITKYVTNNYSIRIDSSTLFGFRTENIDTKEGTWIIACSYKGKKYLLPLFSSMFESVSKNSILTVEAVKTTMNDLIDLIVTSELEVQTNVPYNQ